MVSILQMRREVGCIGHVNKHDPVGPSWDRASPTSSAKAPLWSAEMITSDTCFLNCFSDTKTSTKWQKLTTWWSWARVAQTCWRLRIDNVNPWATALSSRHQPAGEGDSPPPPGLCKCLAETFGEFKVLEPPDVFVLAPYGKSCIFLHHNPMSGDWLCCAFGKKSQVWFGNCVCVWDSPHQAILRVTELLGIGNVSWNSRKQFIYSTVVYYNSGTADKRAT